MTEPGSTRVAAGLFDAGRSFVPPVSLDPGRTALVVVDMQYHDAHPDGCFNVAMERIDPGSMSYFNHRTETVTVPAIARAVSAFRARGLPVIHLVLGSEHQDYRDLDGRFRDWILAVESASGTSGLFWTGNPDFAIRAELAPAASELVVRKTSFGAFNGSRFEQELRTRSLSSLVFTGISTNCCVESTVRDAAERGFGCVVVDEATADYQEDAHLASLRALAFNHARVLGSVDELLAALDSGRPL